MNSYKKSIIGEIASGKQVNRNGFMLISWIMLFLFFAIISEENDLQIFACKYYFDKK